MLKLIKAPRKFLHCAQVKIGFVNIDSAFTFRILSSFLLVHFNANWINARLKFSWQVPLCLSSKCFQSLDARLISHFLQFFFYYFILGFLLTVNLSGICYCHGDVCVQIPWARAPCWFLGSAWRSFELSRDDRPHRKRTAN